MKSASAPILPLEAVEGVRHITGMDPSKSATFLDELQSSLVQFYLHEERSTPNWGAVRDQMKRLDKLSRALRDELDRLPGDCKKWITITYILRHDYPSLGERTDQKYLEEFPNVVGPLLQQCLILEDVANSLHAYLGQRRGAPSKIHGDDHYGGFYRFAMSLAVAIEAGGGRATVNANTGSGTLVDALKLLMPYFPVKKVPGFLANNDEFSSQGLSRLERAKRFARRAAMSTDGQKIAKKKSDLSS